MDSFNTTDIIVFLGGLVAAGFVGWLKDRLEDITRNIGRAERKTERATETTSEQRAELADHGARIEGLEGAALAQQETNAKMASAIERIARIEEWRVITQPKLAEIDATALDVRGLKEQSKTVFRMVEDLNEAVQDMRETMADSVVDKLKRHIKAAAHG